MKKRFIAIMAVMLLVGVAYSATLTNISGNRRDRLIEELVTEMNKLSGGAADLTLDTLVLSSTFTSTGAVSFASTLAVTGKSTLNNDVILENDEEMQNGTDGELEAVYNDDSATLGILTMRSSVDAASIADNDTFSIRGESVDTASNATVYAKIDLQITDTTSTTEDGQAVVTYLTGGAEKTLVVGADASGNQRIQPGADNEIDVGATAAEFKDLFLDGTAHIDTLDVDANAVVTGTLSVTGVTTLVAAPVFTATTSAGNATALLTNAPACTEETPSWITVTISGQNFVVPAWDLD